jgi:hypothetical protein
MTTQLDLTPPNRRGFLRVAAGAAATGSAAIALGARPASGATATTEWMDALDFVQMGGSVPMQSPKRDGAIYPSVAASPFIGILTVPPGRAITALTVHTTGVGQLRALLFPHTIGKGLGKSLTSVVGAPRNGSLAIPLDRDGVAPGVGQRFQLWVFGATATTPFSGASYTLVDAVRPPTPTSSTTSATTAAATTVAVATTLPPPTTAPSTTVAPATTTPTTAAPTTAAPTTTTTAPSTSGYGYLPMSPTSPWNTPIPANTKWYGDPNDTSKHTLWFVPGTGKRRWYLNFDYDGSCGVWFAKPNDPVWTFTLPKELRGHPPTTFQLRAPSNFTVGTRTNGDNPAAIVVDGELWDLYDVKITSKANRTATIFSYGHQPLATGTGFGTAGQMWGNGVWNIDPVTGTRASNTPWGVGLITGDDLKAPAILHALAIATPHSITASRGVAPCTSFDNAGWGPLPSGTRIGIPAGQAMPNTLAAAHWKGLGIKFWNVFQSYGAYIVDTADPVYPTLYSDPVSVPGGDALHLLYAWWDSPYTDSSGNKRAILDLISPYVRTSQPM